MALRESSNDSSNTNLGTFGLSARSMPDWRLKESSVDEIYSLPTTQAEQTSGCCLDTAAGVNASQSPPRAAAQAASASPPSDLLDPVVLRTMPPRVAAFMLYEPPDPPPWRRQETLAQRAHREMLEDCGSWVGE